jgi:type IV secretory pathway VirD2 relaxase
MTQMESDLGTKLDWVAADHYDTGQPHTHIVIRGQRDDGKDLVIPKDYIIHGIRDLVEDLATIELGRIPEEEVKRKIAMGVEAERFTYLDRGLVKKSKDNLVDFSSPMRGQGWRATLERERLSTLSKMGLAAPRGGGVWTLSPNLQQTLTRMSERGDIIRGLQRAVSEHAKGRMVDAGAIHNPHSPHVQAVTGQFCRKASGMILRTEPIL